MPSFNTVFVFDGTKQDLKLALESIGIKVSLPMSHGDSIEMQYSRPVIASAPEQATKISPLKKESKKKRK